MTVSLIDLGALDALDGLDGVPMAGKPILLDVELIHEDPDQPRKVFDDAKLLEFSASVAESGIRVPISVKTHPSLHGHYMLNFGARRLRAAISCGLRQVPALIEELLTDFDQVIENLQRADLTPMEMALFIADKQKEGMKPSEIARRLGLTRSAISKYLALVDAPAEIEAVYAAGRTTSPDTIYDLRAVFSRWPAETKAWLATDVDVTRRSIDAFKHKLGVEGPDLLNTDVSTKPLSDPLIVRRPIIVIQVSDRIGQIVLTRRAVSTDHLLVKWNDSGEVEAVPVSRVHLVRLDDAKRYEPVNRGLRQ